VEFADAHPSSPLPPVRPASETVLPAALPDACWRRIGNQGDRSCPELSQHGHCRNCPTFARAGARLLDREVPAEYRRDWTTHFAVARRPTAPAKASATIFRIGKEWLALDTALLQEVTERRPMHSIPHRSGGGGIVLGLVNVRGELLVCVSLARLMGLAHDLPHERLRQEHRRLVIVHAEPQRFAFPADEVHGVQRFHREELQAPPANVVHGPRTLTRGVLRWRGRTVGWLDAEMLREHLNRSLS
jgi:chemotaxis-related protein WspD